MKKVLARLRDFWKLVVLFSLGALAFSYAMFQGGFVSWFLFYSFLPFAIYGLVLSFSSLKKFTVERSFVKTEYHAGEKLMVNIKLERTSSFPFYYLLIEDCLSGSLAFSTKEKSAKTLVFPWFHRMIEFEYSINSLPRGEHQFTALQLKTGDPLGLIEKQNHISTDDKIIVYPAYEEIVYRPLDQHYDQGLAVSKERVQRDTSMAIGVREYQSGDRFSWINWKATAKRNDFMTKEFEQRKSHDVFVIMDCTPEKRFEAIVSFTASIIRAMLRKGVQVGLLSSSEERVVFPIRGGEAHQQGIFYHLAKVKDKSPVTLEKLLEAESLFMQQNGAMMLITSQLTKSLIEKASYLFSIKGAVAIFLVKNEQESASNDEISLKALANGRGVRVVFVHKGYFSDVFSEVNRG